MTRSFLWFFLGSATAILLGAGVVWAQPQYPTLLNPAPSDAKQDPEVQEALKLLGNRHLAEQSFFRELEEAARRNPERPSANVLMYRILSSMNQPKAAHLYLERAARGSPGDPEPFVILGNIAVGEGRFAEATLDFEKARQLLTTYKNATRRGVVEQQMMIGIAQVAEDREDWKEALRIYLKMSPGNLRVHQRLARSLFAQNMVETLIAANS